MDDKQPSTNVNAKSPKSKNWFSRHKVLTTALVIIALIIIAVATSGGNTTNVNTTASNSASKSNSSTNKSKTSAATAHVGSTVDIGGSKGLAVTLISVIDPASGADQYTTPNAGFRFVAVDVKIVNNGTAAYNDDANSDIVIIGSDNQTYTFDPSDVSECTNFNEGDYTLAAGESATGCVVFQLPNGVNSAKVQFETESGLSGNTGEWLVP